MSYIRPIVLTIALATLALTGEAAAELPTRVCPVKGGYALLQGGVMKDTQTPQMPFGKLKYPVRYVVQVTNHRSEPFWVEVEWAFPGKKEKPVRSKRVASGETVVLWQQDFGVIEGAAIGAHLSFYEDEGFERRIGEARRHIVFAPEAVAAFKAQFSRSDGRAFLSGWPDVEDSENQVPGTAANAQLQADILRELATLEMARRPACRMEALRAESFVPAPSIVLAGLQGEFRGVAEHRVKEGKARWERWTVRSCDVEMAYEVLLMVSPQGGTDVAAALIPATSPAPSEAVAQTPRAPDVAAPAPPGETAAGTAPEAGGTPALVSEESLKDQITLSVPAGWSAYDQVKVITGKSGPVGHVVYSAAKLQAGAGEEDEKALLETMAKFASGEIPNLQLDRLPAPSGATCEGITQSAESRILKMVKEEDPMFSRGRTVLEAPHAAPAGLPGAHGIRIRGRSRDPRGVEWALDMGVVADGKIMYLLYTKAPVEHFEQTREILDRVLQTVTLTRCGAPTRAQGAPAG